MQGELGALGRLLDRIGRMSGHEFRLSQAGESDVLAVRPQVVSQADGRHVCTVSVPVRGAVQLLRGNDNPQSGAAPDRVQALVDVMDCVRQLQDERETAQAESRQLVDELNNAYEDLHLFSRIAMQIRSLRYSEAMLRDLLKEAREAMHVDVAAAWFSKGPQLVHATSRGFDATVPDIPTFLGRLIEELPRSAPALEPNCHIVNDSREIPAFAALHAKPFRALAVRLTNSNRAYGWITLLSFDVKDSFRRGEYRILTSMAEQLALVVANTDLYRDLECFIINLVRCLVMALEAKDSYTKGHSVRVSAMSMRIAEAMRLDAGQCANLQWASVLHDIGKIGTQEAVLNKPGPLSVEEFDTIKAHPERGAVILQPVSQLVACLPAIRHHHERYAGGGYPWGLKGEEIPFAARIIAVADTYDAITSSRAYRPARSHQEAVDILAQIAGTQLDPQIVETFLVQVAPALAEGQVAPLLEEQFASITAMPGSQGDRR